MYIPNLKRKSIAQVLDLITVEGLKPSQHEEINDLLQHVGYVLNIDYHPPMMDRPFWFVRPVKVQLKSSNGFVMTFDEELVQKHGLNRSIVNGITLFKR